MGIYLEWCGTSYTLRKSERVDPTENCPTPGTLCTRDQSLTVMLTGTAPNCRPQPSRTSPALKWSVIVVKPSKRGLVGRVAQRQVF